MKFEGNLNNNVKELLPLINKDDQRLCHKIRTSKYYGGIATVDVVGCYLDCAFCWVPEFKRYSELIEKNIKNFKFYDPIETSEILIKLAEKNNLKSVRLSGGEPTLNKEHLIKTIELTTKKGLNFILETNGLYLDQNYIKELHKFRDNIYIYFSIKGINPKSFEIITQCNSELWYYQMKSLKRLVDSEFTIGINFMSDFYDEKLLKGFIQFLNLINDYLPFAIDIKSTSIFPHVRERLDKRQILMKNQITSEKFWKLVENIYPDLYKKGIQKRNELGSMNFIKFADC